MAKFRRTGVHEVFVSTLDMGCMQQAFKPLTTQKRPPSFVRTTTAVWISKRGPEKDGARVGGWSTMAGDALGLRHQRGGAGFTGTSSTFGCEKGNNYIVLRNNFSLGT